MTPALSSSPPGQNQSQAESPGAIASDRLALAQQRHEAMLAALPAEQRQAAIDRQQRLDAMSVDQRRTYLLGQRLMAVIGQWQWEVSRGVTVAEVLACQDTSDRKRLDWLMAELAKAMPSDTVSESAEKVAVNSGGNEGGSLGGSLVGNLGGGGENESGH